MVDLDLNVRSNMNYTKTKVNVTLFASDLSCERYQQG